VTQAAGTGRKAGFGFGTVKRERSKPCGKGPAVTLKKASSSDGGVNHQREDGRADIEPRQHIWRDTPSPRFREKRQVGEGSDKRRDATALERANKRPTENGKCCKIGAWNTLSTSVWEGGGPQNWEGMVAASAVITTKKDPGKAPWEESEYRFLCQQTSAIGLWGTPRPGKRNLLGKKSLRMTLRKGGVAAWGVSGRQLEQIDAMTKKKSVGEETSPRKKNEPNSGGCKVKHMEGVEVKEDVGREGGEGKKLRGVMG